MEDRNRLTVYERHKELLGHGVLTVPSSEKAGGFQFSYSQWRSEPTEVAQALCSASWDTLQQTGRQMNHIHMLCEEYWVLDIDEKNKSGISAMLREAISGVEGLGAALKTCCQMERTASGGVHMIFRGRRPSSVLSYALTGQDANGKDKYNPTIEIRGANSMCRVYPSEGIALLSDTNFPLPEPEEWVVEILIRLCENFNEKPYEEEETYKHFVRPASDGMSPGEHYTSEADPEEVAQIMVGHGWVRIKRQGSRIMMRRPGAKTGNNDADICIRKRTLMVYSTSVGEFNIGKGYSFFAVKAILDHGSDYSKAAGALAAAGWGKRPEPSRPGSAVQRQQSHGEDPDFPDIGGAEQEDEFAELRTRRVRLTDEYHLDFSLLFTHRDEAPATSKPPSTFDVAGPGMIMGIVGPPKSRKSALLTAIMGSAERGHADGNIGFKLDRRGGSVVVLDTEQHPGWVQRGLSNAIAQTDSPDEEPEWLHYYSLRDKNAAERVQFLDKAVLFHTDLSVLIIDGIKDMVNDFVSDNKEATMILQKLMAISQLYNNVLIIVVLHTNPTTGQDVDKPRGHLGTELMNKADCMILVKPSREDDNTSSVRFMLTRSRKPPAFDFSVFPSSNIPYRYGYDMPEHLKQERDAIKQQSNVAINHVLRVHGKTPPEQHEQDAYPDFDEPF